MKVKIMNINWNIEVDKTHESIRCHYNSKIKRKRLQKFGFMRGARELLEMSLINDYFQDGNSIVLPAEWGGEEVEVHVKRKAF